MHAHPVYSARHLKSSCLAFRRGKCPFVRNSSKKSKTYVPPSFFHSFCTYRQTTDGSSPRHYLPANLKMPASNKGDHAFPHGPLAPFLSSLYFLLTSFVYNSSFFSVSPRISIQYPSSQVHRIQRFHTSKFRCFRSLED